MWARYRSVLASSGVVQALVLGFLVRVPVWASGVVLTLHLVDTLDQTYAAAGLVVASATVAAAVSGPWRGRLVDRIGLRRTVGPALVIAACCWSTAPFVGYWPLLALATVSNLFLVPSFAIIRQAIMVAVPPRERRTAISLDAVVTEASFMVGPILGVWAATQWPTPWVLFTGQMAGVVAGVALWWIDPPLRSESLDAGDIVRVPRREWFRPTFIALCLGATTATVILGGTEIAVVAAMRDFGRTSQIGLVLAVWGLGSLLGGLLYGGLHRSISVSYLLAGLALVTIPMAAARGTLSLTLLGFLAGLLCAPTITATIDQVSRVVPEVARGEALGWHGSALMVGSAFGAPITGAAIDTWGFAGGFIVCALVGLVVALILLGVIEGTRRARPAAAEAQVSAAVQVSAEAQVTAEAQVPAPNTASTAGIAVR